MAGVLLGPGPLTKSVAAPYDATATYGVGDHCSKDGKIYICVSAITTAEAWTAAHWERVMVEEEIEDTKKGLAYVEEGTIASQNIAAGSYVWWQGQMCVAASAIAVGDTLSTTNLTIKSDGGLNDLNSKIDDKHIGYYSLLTSARATQSYVAHTLYNNRKLSDYSMLVMIPSTGSGWMSNTVVVPRELFVSNAGCYMWFDGVEVDVKYKSDTQVEIKYIASSSKDIDVRIVAFDI